jgi:hypothetical protein
MSDERQPRSSIARPLLWGGLAMLVLRAAVIVWTARRQAQNDRLIQQKLAALRAAGEPVTGADLAKLFPAPPPELDAMRYFSNAMEFAATNRPPSASPLVWPTTLGRNAALDEGSLSVLRAYQSDTALISNLLASVPSGARFGHQWNPTVINAPVVPFFKVRCLMQSLCTRAFYSAEVGDAEGASRMLASGFQFASAISSESTLVEHMIRSACLELACYTTELCLNRTRFSEQQLARILEAMPAADTNGIAATLRVEQCMAIEAFTAVKAGKRLGQITGAKVEPWWKRAWQKLRPHRPEYSDEDFISYLDVIPAMQRMAKLPPAHSVQECRRLFDGLGSNTVSEIGEAIYPNWSKGLANLYKNEAHLASLKMALHVERFRSARGALPSSLEALVPEFTPAISPDLFDGKPLRFKALTNGFAVYSIGIDGIDDGGLENTNANALTNYDVTVIVER